MIKVRKIQHSRILLDICPKKYFSRFFFGGGNVPSAFKKIEKNYLSGKYQVKFRNFVTFSDFYHVKFGHFVCKCPRLLRLFTIGPRRENLCAIV